MYDISLWESLALSLAKNAGIKVPKWHIANVSEKNILVLNRFDRAGKNRIPFISAMTMLGADDREQHGFLLKDKRGWELSPAYDMNPVPRVIRPNSHELSINAVSTEGSIDTVFGKG